MYFHIFFSRQDMRHSDKSGTYKQQCWNINKTETGCFTTNLNCSVCVCACVFVKCLENKRMILSSQCSFPPCDVIIAGTQIISFSTPPPPPHLFSFSYYSCCHLFCVTMETMFTGRTVWNPLRQKEVHDKHTCHTIYPLVIVNARSARRCF